VINKKVNNVIHFLSQIINNNNKKIILNNKNVHVFEKFVRETFIYIIIIIIIGKSM